MSNQPGIKPGVCSEITPETVEFKSYSVGLSEVVLSESLSLPEVKLTAYDVANILVPTSEANLSDPLKTTILIMNPGKWGA